METLPTVTVPVPLCLANVVGRRGKIETVFSTPLRRTSKQVSSKPYIDEQVEKPYPISSYNSSKVVCLCWQLAVRVSGPPFFEVSVDLRALVVGIKQVYYRVLIEPSLL
jgi:hypothetical protein